MVIGMLWQLYAVGLNVTRIFSLELLNKHTYIDITTNHAEHEIMEFHNNGNCSKWEMSMNNFTCDLYVCML